MPEDNKLLDIKRSSLDMEKSIEECALKTELLTGRTRLI
jgi:hypothetical protein